MSEDPTQQLPSSFEERVMAEFAAMRTEFSAVRQELSQLNSRLTALEEKVDERLRETRPIWEGVQQRLTEIEAELKTFNRQFKTFVRDLFDLRSRVEKLEDEQPAT